MTKKITLIALIIYWSSSTGFCQELFTDIRYNLEAGAMLSGKTPFWMRANHYGIVPLEGPFIAFRASLHKEYDSTGNQQNRLKKFDIGYGIRGAANAGKLSGVFLPEAYVKVRYKAFEFYGGRRREVAGLIDTTLSSGSYIWSGNALPIPKVQISIPNYTSIIGRGIIAIKGNYSHGWFGKQNETEGYYLHQKSLYGRIGRDTWNFNFYGGVNHQVQWGGYSEILKNDSFFTKDGYFASDPLTYLCVVLPAKWKIPANKYSPNEYMNRFGNHLGSVDFGFRVKSKLTDIYFYRQSPYEDGQMAEVFLSGDGNYSLTLDLKVETIVKKINFGYLDTRRQGGELSGLARLVGKKEKHNGEVQNYFNHGQYREGWSYNENGIGTPLIIPTKDLTAESQTGTYLFTSDNRVKSFYLAMTGNASGYPFLLQSSVITSLGNFGLPRNTPLKQFSLRMSVNVPLKKLGLESKVDVAFDTGKLYGNNAGVSYFLVKKW